MNEPRATFPSIFNYNDYRRFLEDYYNHSKQLNRYFSYRFFARKANITSHNLLHYIINGKKNLTKDFLPKFAMAIGLNEREHRFFDILVSYNHSKDDDAKNYYWNLLQNLRQKE
jgi:uncharacterized protein (TIGR02147 family)